MVQSYYPQDPRIRRQAEALVQAGFRVEVVCLRGPKEKPRDEVNGVNVIRLPLSRRRGSVLRYLFEYIAFFFMAAVFLTRRFCHYDVIHVSNMPDFLVFAAFAPKCAGTRVILDEHDPMPEIFMSRYGIAKTHPVIRLLRWQEKISLLFAHHIITVTDAMRDRFVPLISDESISIIMNLPEDQVFSPVERCEISSNKRSEFSLIFTGTITDTYDLAVVVQSIANLRKDIPELCVKIVGDGPDIPALRQLAGNLKVADRVMFMGQVPFARIPELIAESDIGISTLKPGPLIDLCFYTKTAEYVAMGIPSIAARTGVVERYYPDGIICFYEPGDQDSFDNAISKLYANSALRYEMSREGIAFSKASNWSIEKGKYIGLIDKLCN